MTILLTRGQRNLHTSLRRVLDTFLKDEDLARGIFLKPNIVFPVKDTSGEITRLALVRALVEILRERHSNVDIVIAEGVAVGCSPQENFTVSGYSELAKSLNVPLIDLNGAERRNVSWKFGTLKLPKMAFERTYINLPILKPSSACIISGAIKNQKGLVPAAMKKQFHRLGLHEQLAELNTLIQPLLTIMDGSNFFGVNSLLSGRNCGEIDAAACQLLGIEEPEHIRLAREVKVFTDGYEILGDQLRLQRGSDRPMMKQFKTMGRLRLWSNPQACSRCRYLFQEIKSDLLKRENFEAAWKLLPYSLKGAEIIMGSNAKWQKEYETVICFGECTRLIAKEGNFIHIPGCPPRLEDMVEHLSGDEKKHSLKGGDQNAIE